MADDDMLPLVVRLERMANQRSQQLREAGSLMQGPSLAMQRAALVALLGALAVTRLCFG